MFGFEGFFAVALVTSSLGFFSLCRVSPACDVVQLPFGSDWANRIGEWTGVGCRAQWYFVGKKSVVTPSGSWLTSKKCRFPIEQKNVEDLGKKKMLVWCVSCVFTIHHLLEMTIPTDSHSWKGLKPPDEADSLKTLPLLEVHSHPQGE